MIVPWLNIWNTAPVIPCVFMDAIPRMTIPMWLMLEYAMSFLKSVCAMATSAPYTMLITPSSASSQEKCRIASGNIGKLIRSIP